MWRLLEAISPSGRLLGVTVVVAWVLGAVLGWDELVLLGATGALLLGLACALTLGRGAVRVRVDVASRRLRAGESTGCSVQVEHHGRRSLFAPEVELPIGEDRVEVFDRGREIEVVGTRRGVIGVGPAVTVRGDPLGLVRRTVGMTDVVELFVHPVTVPLEPLGTGLLRDLEGCTTNDVSMSDLAFHALREYAPGDDRRHIHWRSTAKLAASAQDARFLVRQYLDTRRAHIAVIVDGAEQSYPDPEVFETALSAGASVVTRAALDEIDTTVVAGDHVSSRVGGHVLDVFARAAPGGLSLAQTASRAVVAAPDVTLVVLVTGTRHGYADLRAAASAFSPEVRKVVLRVDPAGSTTRSASTPFTVLTLRRLADLPGLLAGGTLQ
ncbi:DUF58 domain-containing protein [Lentzea californiensis]|uniref:DUF58 domain-containing protein n=1 Tax=Lentzea californiensis TaxID=438851 RepID=UPI002165C5E1|nr:DUF58 domain-containing protein [Lentzea californiensis]MCR3753756.1 Uncharacterized conserved protein, DUF58 family, contains vWF domain [Lentzea californiensis]